MTHRYHLESLDGTIKGITRLQHPFRGKCLILAGDYRQILPVISGGSRAQITAASMKKSTLWRFFTVFEFKVNIISGQDPSLHHFDTWLLKLGNGDLLIAEQSDSIHIPPEYLFEIQDESVTAIKEFLRQFVKKVFPTLIQISKPQSNSRSLGQQKGQFYSQKTAQLIRLMPSSHKNYCLEKPPFYPLLTVHVSPKIQPDFPWNSSTSSPQLDSLHITST